MNKLSNLVILVDEVTNESWEKYLKKVANGKHITEDIYKYVEENKIKIVSITDNNHQADLDNNFDFMIVEDEPSVSILLTIASVNYQKIKNVVIVSSLSCVEFLLKSKFTAPPVISLDFLLEPRSNESPEINNNFKLTQDLYKRIKTHWKNSKIIGISGFLQPDGEPFEIAKDLVVLMRNNWDDMYVKGENLYKFLPYLLRNAIENYKQRLENERLGITLELERNENTFIKRQISKLNADNNLPEKSPVPEIIGESIAMKLVYFSLQRFANQPIVLIEGDRGTGKGLIAKALHDLGDRRKKPFVKIPCARFNNSPILDSELFGHEKGAFTGANEKKIGLIESANGGTVFFDEIGEISREFQDKLLDFIETKKILKSGSNKEITVDVNIITATNKDLRKLVKEDKFKDDLYDRLQPPFRKLPPLNQRKEDIVLLANHILKKKSQIKGREFTFSEEALYTLRKNDWKGNVRELEKVIDLTIIYIDDYTDVINSNDLMFVNLDNGEDESIPFSNMPGLSKEKISRAWDYLDALENACQNCENAGENITQENVSKYFVTPKGKVAPNRASISIFFTDYNKELNALFSDNVGKWALTKKLKNKK